MTASTLTTGPRRLAGRFNEVLISAAARSHRSSATDTPLAAKVVTWVLGAIAALCVWLVVFAVLLSGMAESHAQHGLYDLFRAQLASGTAPVSDAVPTGTPVAAISISQAGLTNTVIVQGTSSTALRNGPGHLPGTPLPGQPGASVVMGRSTSFGAPFGNLTSLTKGDRFTVVTGEGTLSYRVEDLRRPGDPLPAQLPPGASQLTLVTAEGNGWRSGWAPTHAVFVDAVLQGAARSLGPGSGVPASDDNVLTSDTSGLYPLVLWMQLLVVAVVGGFWARRRWGLWQSWMVATPVGLAALWGASINAWMLLPNIY